MKELLVFYEAYTTVTRTHDGPKIHAFPYVYTPYLVLDRIKICSLVIT